MNRNLFFILLKNEVAEQFRSRKLIAIVFVFLFFGLMSPITAMFMPEIFASISESQNIKIEIPDPVWTDAVVQYVKNMSQMISFILIIVYMGIIAREKENGILVFLLVKPVSRSAFMLSKYASVCIAVFAGISASFIAASFYTFLFFEGFVVMDFLLLNLFLMLNLMSTLFIVVLFSSLFKSQIIAGILSFFVYLIISLTSQFEKLAEFLPSGLLVQGNNAISGQNISLIPVFSTILLMAACVVISIVNFRKWEA